MKRILTVVAAVTAFAVIGAVPAMASQTTPAQPSNTELGELENYNSIIAGVKLCLGISGSNINADAILWYCSSDGQKNWTTGATNSAGYYQIYWTTSSGVRQCLGVAGGKTASLTRVVGWNCGGPSHPDQYWKIIYPAQPPYCGDGFIIKNYKSQRVLGIAGDSDKVGAPAVIYKYAGACDNQFWD